MANLTITWEKDSLLLLEGINKITQNIKADQLAHLVGNSAKPLIKQVQDSEYVKMFSQTLQEVTRDFENLSLGIPIKIDLYELQLPTPQELNKLRLQQAIRSQDVPWIAASLIEQTPQVIEIKNQLKKESHDNSKLLYQLFDTVTSKNLSAHKLEKLKLFLVRECAFARLQPEPVVVSWERAIGDWTEKYNQTQLPKKRIEELHKHINSISCVFKNNTKFFAFSEYKKQENQVLFRYFIVTQSVSEILSSLAITTSFDLNDIHTIFWQNEHARQLFVFYCLQLAKYEKQSTSPEDYIQQCHSLTKVFELLAEENSTTSANSNSKEENFDILKKFLQAIKWYLFFKKKSHTQWTIRDKSWDLFEILYHAEEQALSILEEQFSNLSELPTAIYTLHTQCTYQNITITPQKRLFLAIHYAKKKIETVSALLTAYTEFADNFSTKDSQKRLEILLSCENLLPSPLLQEHLKVDEVITSSEEMYLQAIVKFQALPSLTTLVKFLCERRKCRLSFDEWIQIGLYGPNELIEEYGSQIAELEKMVKRLAPFSLTRGQEMLILLQHLKKRSPSEVATRATVSDHIDFISSFLQISKLPQEIIYSCLLSNDLSKSKLELLNHLHGIRSKDTTLQLQEVNLIIKEVTHFALPEYVISPAPGTINYYKNVLSQFALLSVCNWSWPFDLTPAISISKLPFPETDNQRSCFLSAGRFYWYYLPGFTYDWVYDANDDKYDLQLTITKNLDSLETTTKKIRLDITKFEFDSLFKSQKTHYAEYEKLLKHLLGNQAVTLNQTVNTSKYDRQLAAFAISVDSHIQKVLRNTTLEMAPGFGNIYSFQKEEKVVYSLINQEALEKNQHPHCFFMDSLEPFKSHQTSILQQKYSFTINRPFLEKNKSVQKEITCKLKNEDNIITVEISIANHRGTYTLKIPLTKEGCDGVTWTPEELCRLIAWQVLMAQSKVYEKSGTFIKL